MSQINEINKKEFEIPQKDIQSFLNIHSSAIGTEKVLKRMSITQKEETSDAEKSLKEKYNSVISEILIFKEKIKKESESNKILEEEINSLKNELEIEKSLSESKIEKLKLLGFKEDSELKTTAICESLDAILKENELDEDFEKRKSFIKEIKEEIETLKRKNSKEELRKLNEKELEIMKKFSNSKFSRGIQIIKKELKFYEKILGFKIKEIIKTQKGFNFIFLIGEFENKLIFENNIFVEGIINENLMTDKLKDLVELAVHLNDCKIVVFGLMGNYVKENLINNNHAA